LITGLRKNAYADENTRGFNEDLLLSQRKRGIGNQKIL